ncbi:MAG: LTA synthase family protein [Bacilli bacterium]|nr:LTA synthase family protein [Bacilli bacterium]
MKSKILRVLHVIAIILSLTAIIAAIYLKINFSSTNFEEVIFYLRVGVEDADSSAFWDGLKICGPIVLFFAFIFYTLFYDIFNGKKKISTKKGKVLYPIKGTIKHRKLITWLLFGLGILALMWSVRLFNFIVYTNFKSTFIEEHYVDPASTKITFDKKRNLILIVVESLETTLFTKDQGGYWDYPVTDGLYQLLEDPDAVVFYNEDNHELTSMLEGASWTTASVVANSTGVPFKIRINKNQYHSQNFMNGSYALGDLLKDNGYHNEVISAAKTSFGGLKEYFTKHGSYDIIDSKSLNKYGFSMKESDKGKWGFNDNYLFDIAKKRLEVISNNEEPFNLELITIDTHFVDGFVGNYSETKYDEQYENAYATTSRLIYDFVNYVKEQDYYKDTTIMVIGDHLSMQNEFFRKRGAKDDDRYVYSVLINPKEIKEEYKNNERIVTALDTYPTLVYAIGGSIEGNKLGLGVNLFSSEKTLAEKYGVKKLDKELKKKSVFYNNKILDDDYLKKYELGKGSN